jgi:hypothetical protein
VFPTSMIDFIDFKFKMIFFLGDYQGTVPDTNGTVERSDQL